MEVEKIENSEIELTKEENSNRQMLREIQAEVRIVDSFMEGLGEVESPVEKTENPVDNDNRMASMLGVKNLVGKFNDSIFAKVIVDDNGNRHIEFYQKYSDGSFSPKITVKQSELLRAVLAEKNSTGNASKSELQRSKRFFDNVQEEYLGKLCLDCGEILNIHDVLLMLAAVMPKVRISQNSVVELRRIDLYQKVIETAKRTSVFTLQDFEEHRYFYAFSQEAFEYVAEVMGVTRINLLEKLDRFDLLYINDSSCQYKTNVRVHGEDGKTYTAWRYCIKIVKFQKDGDESSPIVNF